MEVAEAAPADEDESAADEEAIIGGILERTIEGGVLEGSGG